MNTIREVEQINQRELEQGIAGTSASWHNQYLKSAWVYVGNLEHELSEGDVICVLSQYGEIEDIHLVREEDTGKSRGFAFAKYEDARSCVLAVDNFVGVKLLGRSMRVDHVEKYRLPKKLLEQEEAKEARNLGAGHAYEGSELSNQYTIEQGQDLFAPNPQPEEDDRDVDKKEAKKLRREEREARRRRKEERRSERGEHKRHKRSRQYREETESPERDSGEDRKRHKKRRHHEKKRRKHSSDEKT